MKTYLLIALAFFSFHHTPVYAFGRRPVQVPAPTPKPVPKPTPIPPPKPLPPSSAEATCPAAGTVQAVDLSNPVNQRFLDVMKQLQVTTIIRYYDHTNETIRGKTLKPAEVELLARNGFDAMVVFQHNNSSITSFTTTRGTADANRSLELAAANKQTKGSAIYFGVDGSWSSTKDLTAIKAYFGKAAPLVRAGGFKVGTYGSGLVCTELLKQGLTDYCWLANAKGWPGYSAFLASNAWSMVQKLPTDCGGKNADFNVMSASLRDIGQFRP